MSEIQKFIVGPNEVPPEIVKEGGIVVGSRQDRVAFVFFEPGGAVTFSIHMSPEMAVEIAESLLNFSAEAEAFR
jgi:hypothetical protein